MRDMKDSGVEWLGKIPNHWTIQRIKNLFELRNERNYEVLEDVNLISLYTDKGVVQHSDLTETTGNKAVTADGYKIVKENDIVVNIILCWMGAVGRSDYNGVTSPAYDVYKPLGDTNSKYYHYLFRTSQFNGECYRYGRGIMLMRWRTYSTEFKAISIPVPPVDEQQRIVELLDKKANDVDRLIGNVQKQIEKLKSYKQSLITEVVTKGLDSTVPMKDSGVEWIGEIPVHWTVIRLKHLYDHSNGSPVRVGPFGSALPSSELADEGVWVYNQRTVLDKNFKTNNTFISEKKADELSGFSVYPKDILVTTRGSIGKTAIVPDGAPRGVLHPCVIRFRINEKRMNNELLSCIFNETNICLGQIMDMSNSTTIEVLYSYSLKEIWMPCPPIVEQDVIYKYICDLNCKFNRLIAIKQSKVEKLEQYKRSIIYEYVTGKREVS